MAQAAARQHGVVTRAQILAAGLDTSSIARRVSDGRLHRLHRGVYAVGHRALTANGHRLAAVLAPGPGAVLSHRSAADAWGLRRDHRSRFEVITPRGGGRGLTAVDAHRVVLASEDRTTQDAVPMTTVARTVVDLAAVVRGDQLLGALERAEELRVLDLRAIEAAIRRAPRQRGIAKLRSALDALRPERSFTRSELERRALALADRYGLRRPAANALVCGHEVDLLWREQGVIVELDGFAFHRTRAAFERDRRRDAELTAHGYRVLRFTWRQLEREPERVAAILAAVLRP